MDVVLWWLGIVAFATVALVVGVWADESFRPPSGWDEDGR